MKFENLNLPEYILKGLKEQGFDEATEIQSLCIPKIKDGHDIVGLSQTGSGKTYAFGIPAIECIDPDIKGVQALIICPTRELATQVADEMRKLSSLKEGAKIVPVFGGSNLERQIIAIKKNAKIIVGTPGRLMDHLRRKTLKLENLKMLVLDEADEMLDMGFREDIEEILKSVNKNHQTVMFSATMPKPIMEITKGYMRNPIVIKSAKQDDAQDFIQQYFVTCGRDKKLETVLEIYKKNNFHTSLIFCNTKRMVEELTKELNKKSSFAVCLHGDMRQNERKRVMDKFKINGGILVATDVAARGIDIKNVDAVLNFDIPNNHEYYVHRIGRTARAGNPGISFTIVNTKGQLKNLNDLIRETKNKIEEYPLFENSSNQFKNTDSQTTTTKANSSTSKQRNNTKSRKIKAEDLTIENSKFSKKKKVYGSNDFSQKRNSSRKTDDKIDNNTFHNHAKKKTNYSKTIGLDKSSFSEKNYSTKRNSSKHFSDNDYSMKRETSKSFADKKKKSLTTFEDRSDKTYGKKKSYQGFSKAQDSFHKTNSNKNQKVSFKNSRKTKKHNI